MDCGGKRGVFEYATKLLSRFFGVYPLLFYFLSSKEFFGKDRPRQLALNKSITAYQLRNLAHDTEYVISLYVLFGSVEGPGITTSARTCEYRQDVQVATTAHNPCVSGSASCIPTKALHCTSCTPTLYLLHPTPIIFLSCQGHHGGGGPLPCQPAVPCG